MHNLLGITIGDPAGIGPEVSLKALNDLSTTSYTPLLIGRAEVIKRTAENLSITKPLHIINSSDSIYSNTLASKEVINIFDVHTDFPLPITAQGNRLTGLESLLYIDIAINLWKTKEIHAIVTAPVNKSLIEESGTAFIGHTEYLATAIGEINPYMMMYSQKYSVLLITTHHPLTKLSKLITFDSIYNTIQVGNDNLQRILSRPPRIAICGLDPHCGDNGAIGAFDTEVTAIAVKKAYSEGVNIEGPYAADTLFMPSRWSQFDLVIAHFHDQGLIPFKMLAFDSGVNVTLGLSLVRTSVDHGTAFDIAGKGIASHTSMIEAIKLAHKLLKL